MAYYSGTAASLTALRTALLTHAQADGWVLTGDVISKAGVYFRIQETATHITCLGCESDLVANPAPAVVSIGRIFEAPGYPTREITYPCSYEVFGFAQELYLVVNYDVDSYQWMALGKTTVPGVPGQGGWCGASIGLFQVLGGAFSTYHPITLNQYGGGGDTWPDATTSAALFWSHRASSAISRNCWVNHGMDGHGWTYNGASGDAPIGIRATSPFVATQPNAWNSESVLLPMPAWKTRPSFNSSLICLPENARHVRIDNLQHGDILTLGSDKWKVFPWYRKDLVARDGGSRVNHTGTFGWAIRYEGP